VRCLRVVLPQLADELLLLVWEPVPQVPTTVGPTSGHRVGLRKGSRARLIQQRLKGNLTQRTVNVENHDPQVADDDTDVAVRPPPPPVAHLVAVVGRSGARRCSGALVPWPQRMTGYPASAWAIAQERRVRASSPIQTSLIEHLDLSVGTGACCGSTHV